MRKIYSLLLVTIILSSCGDKKVKSLEAVIASQNLEQIRAKKTEFEKSVREINIQLDSLNAAISKLDTVKKLPLVTTFLAKQSVFNHYLELQGNVTTKQNVLVYPEMPGIIESISVKEGQSVKKGQILAKIDDGGLSQQLAQVETQLALAKTSFERQKRLWDQKIGSEMQFLQAKSSYVSQTKVVEQIKSQLSKAVITAPFSGVIDDVFKEQGTVVSPGMGSEVFRIINLTNMYIEAEVPESYIKNVTKGKRTEVYFPVLGKTFETTIRQVGNFINPNNRSFKVEIGVPNKNGSIKPNLTAKIKLNDYTSNEAFLIPQSIISENAEGQQYVYIVNNSNAKNEGVAERVIIETGKTQGDVIEVLSGVKKGAQIIKEGARSVRSGQTVKVIKY
ncbi:efflux RND transporter periplasmic adaptor subunit [Polaribacter ponticola]|uniref:Efflux RND transporter periplasmic adaptor subunit n=1 Tax=Polaribacter ponticola TaxID=2978475 RepID=A0ABT5SBI7_9FLAO|nr:efflux RND transporter periplasmic adaptor subunit [Polaribacter sp. MSW5]MDD7915493.1 efflux RND transporter periplasmic adaptor subunit [Polaribacter sp. MSW5]